MTDFLPFILETLVPAARGVLLPAFAALGDGADLNVESKRDGSPASDADREAERALRERIAARYPDHGIIGEEFGSDNAAADYVWVLDPLDGTKEFLARESGWGTLIGLLHHGRPVAGIIDEPLRGLAHAGTENPHRGGIAATRDFIVSCTGPATMFVDTPYESGISRLFSAVREVRPRLNCAGFAHAATGEIDLAIENDLKLHDIVALLPVLWRSGAVCCRLDGSDYAGHAFDLSDLSRNYGLIAGAPAFVREALAVMEA